MNSFETIGSMQLLAYEGQRQIAAAVAQGVGKLLRSAARVLSRTAPLGTMGP
jgi:hypothetical protein